jgi:hypothetical protein
MRQRVIPTPLFEAMIFVVKHPNIVWVESAFPFPAAGKDREPASGEEV